ncbi:MAG TPA: response regulator [Stellaceae bacterium]|jgi:PAS domain S-box-containing protein|nr:response regulator [Stellaceae bacterium]
MSSREPVQFLLVDDLEENLLALEALLRRDGLELFKARSGRDALELLLLHDFALALVDVQMPGMDGFELAELMRGTDRTRQVPIIFITAVATDERRHFRGYEAGAIDYLLKPVEPQILRNKAQVFFELEQQRRELAAQRDQLARNAERLSQALDRLNAHSDNSPLAVLEFDPEFRLIAWSNGAERLFGWKASEAIGRRPAEIGLMGSVERGVFAELHADLLTGSKARTMGACSTYRKDGSVLDCEWYSSALRNAAGRLISINSQVLDITERRRAEETQRLLIAELNHRVKNTLATVQAIATQTLRHSIDPAEFATNFSGRIQALAQAHSLLSDATWKGADLAELIRDQLRLGSLDQSRVVTSGPEIRLPPQLALHLALILHELGTNARKYGALSAARGEVLLKWSVSDTALSLLWVERGGPAVSAPEKSGFGTTLIEQSVKAEGGTAHMSCPLDGIVWNMTLAFPRVSSAGVMNRPLERDSAFKQPPPSSEPVQPTSGGLSARRFLIVEDEPLVALVLTGALEDVGAEIVGTAASVDDALRLVEIEPIDAAILDCNLRGCPVHDVAAALAGRGVPFLFVSGYGRGGLPPGFADAPVLGKPFTQAQLLRAVVELITPIPPERIKRTEGT